MKLDIEAIDDQAEKIADEKCQMPGEYHPDWHSVYAEAFASLIVERCAKRCEEEDVAPTDDPIGVQECIATSIRNLLED